MNLSTFEYTWMMLRGQQYTSNLGYTYHHMGFHSSLTNIIMHSEHDIEELIVTRKTIDLKHRI